MAEPLVIMPNMEGVLVAFLLEQTELTAILPGVGGTEAIGTEIPKRATFPRIRATQIYDVKHTSRPLWSAEYQIQVEAYGGSKSQASSIARTAEGVIAARMTGIRNGIDGNPAAVVAGVTIGAMIDEPDESFEPAKPRFLFIATIIARPVGIVSA